MGLSGLKSFETPLAGASLGGPLVSRGLWVFDHERIRGHHQEQPALHLHRGTDHNTRAHSHTDCSRVTFCRDMHKGHARSCIAFLFSIFCVLTIVVLLWCCYGIEANILNRAFSPLGVHHFHSILTRAFVRLLNACMGFRCAVSSPLLEHLLGKALYSGCRLVKPHSCSLPNIRMQPIGCNVYLLSSTESVFHQLCGREECTQWHRWRHCWANSSGTQVRVKFSFFFFFLWLRSL